VQKSGLEVRRSRSGVGRVEVASRRYLSIESLAKALADPIDEPEEVIAIPAAA